MCVAFLAASVISLTCFAAVAGFEDASIATRRGRISVR